jgi:hypothetical protein
MDRRHFLASGLGFMLEAKVHAMTHCNTVACRSEVNLSQFAMTAYQPQLCPQWCWAASIAMIFAYHGHPVTQMRIVQQVYGSAVCFPAGNAMTIASQLSRNWVDDSGQPFSSRLVAAFDAQAGVYAINNQTIIQQLDSDQPMIFCNQHHAMVLTAIDYRPTSMGPYVMGLGVVDPWPGMGAHALSPAESVMAPAGQCMFLAAVEIDD